ncbi:hypothetical protein HS088_TW01G00537 [Tripterygium wilfordii]|uniref:Uncharacterized protein n=1 Tax=Tripterygium wilfordii TaxID=458696 RepID=A0A7J7E1S5_TRIWF|nr:hypothetical protein HS088_TW01G00537 [Tripterygium wilfordii]
MESRGVLMWVMKHLVVSNMDHKFCVRSFCAVGISDYLSPKRMFCLYLFEIKGFRKGGDFNQNGEAEGKNLHIQTRSCIVTWLEEEERYLSKELQEICLSCLSL